MKTMLCYYSYGGKTKAIAEAVAQSVPMDIFQIEEVKKRNFFTVWVTGIVAARGGKESEIKPCAISMKGVERIILMAPIWAGYNAPALNSFIEEVGPKLRGKQVVAVMTSVSGMSKAKKNIESAIQKHGAYFKGFLDLQAKDVEEAKNNMTEFLAKL